MGADLLNCPFCGSVPRLFSYDEDNGSRNPPTMYAVTCDTCDADTKSQRDEQSAIATWNRRTPPQAAQGDASAVTRNLRAGVDTAPPRAEVSEELARAVLARYVEESPDEEIFPTRLAAAARVKAMQKALTAALAGGGK